MKMIEIKGLKNGKAEYFDNEEGMEEFLEMNKDVLPPYLERMLVDFELTKEELDTVDAPTIIVADDEFINCLDPLVRKEYKYPDHINSIIVNDIGISKFFEEYNNDNSFFIYELSAEMDGIMHTSLIDKYGKIRFWNPDIKSINLEDVETYFKEG